MSMADFICLELSLTVVIFVYFQVKLILDVNSARDTIAAELFQDDCSGDLPCSTLEHSILHTDSQSFVTFTVVSQFICMIQS